MNAREQLEIMVRTDPGSMTVWSPAQVRDTLDVFAAEERANHDQTTVAWLLKKAAEYRSARGPQNTDRAETIERLADKVRRGAVRVNNLRMPSAAGQAAEPQRCPSCDHEAKYHAADDGRCWFTVDHGIPGSNLVCPCAQTETTGAES